MDEVQAHRRHNSSSAVDQAALQQAAAAFVGQTNPVADSFNYVRQFEGRSRRESLGPDPREVLQSHVTRRESRRESQRFIINMDAALAAATHGRRLD